MFKYACKHCFLATTGYDNNKGQVGIYLLTTTCTIYSFVQLVLHNSHVHIVGKSSDDMINTHG